MNSSTTTLTRYAATLMLGLAVLAGISAVTAAKVRAAAGTAPIISNIVANPGTTGATVTWLTDQSGTSQVLYGLTSAYNASSTLGTSNVTSHASSLGGLLPNTLYHFQVVTGNASGTVATSSDMTFTTLIASSTATATSTDASNLQAQIDALKARIAILEAEIASMSGMMMSGGGTSTLPVTGSGMLSPSSITVKPGGSINFGGRGFPREENITIMLNGSQIGTAHADGGGNFSTGSMTAPSTPGIYLYMFIGDDGDITSATVTVQ